MPQSVIYTAGIELGLIFVTIVLLMQPRFIMKLLESRSLFLAKWMGMIFLGLTFLWSIILGMLLSMNQLSLRL